MRESVIYQKILKEGRQEGEIKGRQEGIVEGQIEGCQRTLVNLLKGRFGELDPAFLNRIHQINDLAKLDAAALMAVRIQSLDELQL